MKHKLHWRNKWTQKKRKKTSERTNPKQFIQLIFFSSHFCCLYNQCLSCLIVKCMLLTFIFNYFSSSEVFFYSAPLPDFIFVFFSILNLTFLLHVPGGYLCCTYNSLLNTNTRALRRDSLTRKKHEEILFYAMCTRNPLREERRVESRSSSFYLFFLFNRKYGRNREPVLVGEHQSVVSTVEGKMFSDKTHSTLGRFSDFLFAFRGTYSQSPMLREISTNRRESPDDFFSSPSPIFPKNKIKRFFFWCLIMLEIKSQNSNVGNVADVEPKMSTKTFLKMKHAMQQQQHRHFSLLSVNFFLRCFSLLFAQLTFIHTHIHTL